MTPQNEPMTGFSPTHKINTMGFTAEMERDFIKTDLGPALERGGWAPNNFIIMILDHDRGWLPQWADIILNDTLAAKYVDGVAVHWYGPKKGAPEKLGTTHDRHPNYFILATEACSADWSKGPEERVSLGNWEFGQDYAEDIIRDMIYWASGWVDWNMVLDMMGMPNWLGTRSTQSAPIIVNKDKNEYYKNPTFYAIGHFSKFLPPGSQRIGMSPEKIDDNGFHSIIFRRPDNGTSVIVINTRKESQVLTFEDSEIGQLKMQIEPNSFNSWVYYN